VNETEELRALMEADRWIDRVSAQRSHLPESIDLEALEVQLRLFAKSLSDAKVVQAPVRSRYEQAQMEANRLAKRAGDLEATLSASTANARELAALHGELEHVRQLQATGEDRELELMIEVEPLDEAVARIKSLAQPAMQRRGELLATIGELQCSLDEELLALREARAQRAKALSSDLLSRYEAILKRVGASGAATIDAGRCDGCRIALSPLDLDRWKAQSEGTFMPCPECGRLLLP
jgi:predicted  nucleic acid-binding Zn-ribbon protein